MSAPPRKAPDELAASADRAVIIDDFLRTDVLQKLLPLFEIHAAWEDVYGIVADHTKVTLAEFEAAEPQRKLYHLLSLEKTPDIKALTPTWIAWIFLKQFFDSKELLQFVADASGVNPTYYQGHQCHIMQRGHFINPHSDDGKNRVLCGVLYAGAGWRPGYGAEFEILRDGKTVDLAEPLPNRLVLFRPRSAPRHRVRPITEAAKDWKRKSITLWWADGPLPTADA